MGVTKSTVLFFMCVCVVTDHGVCSIADVLCSDSSQFVMVPKVH